MFQKLNFNQSRVQADLRELWSVMKRQGQFKEYSDYDDYLARRNQPKERQPNNQRQEDLMIEAQVKARFASKREPAPALEKIKADVRAYDKEIDVSLIPF